MTQPERNPGPSGQAAHFRALEALYAAAPINRLFESTLVIPEPGIARIHFTIDERYFHAAFYAANSLVTDRFLLTTAFNLLLTKPLREGPGIAEGRWISGQRRVFVAEARLIDSDGEEAARGTGTFMRSRIALAGLPGYRAE